MRVYVLYILIAFLVLYAWRDWFRALCGLIILTAIIEHPDMPKAIAGIQGLNPWNVVLASVIGSWLIHRRFEGLRWDMPRSMMVLLILYMGVLLFGVARMLLDQTNLGEYSTGTLISEYLVNTFKWVVPALLLYDGCRSRVRLSWALTCTAVLYLLLALQVIRCTPLSALSGATDLNAMRLRIQDRTGYNAVNASAMLAGASWAIVAVIPIVRRRWHQIVIASAALVVFLGQALTGGRMGFVAWAFIGLSMALMRWRKGLLLAPLIGLLLPLAVPGMMERMMQGFGQSSLSGQSAADESQVTSGRTDVWPVVIEQIGKSPVIGFGMLAMARTGVRARLPEHTAEYFAHPHCAYLEALLNYGAVGLAIILALYGTVVAWSVKLFRNRQSRWAAAVGGFAFALVMAQLVASVGSQHFYPRESTVGMWLAVAMLVRVWVQRTQSSGQRVAAGQVVTQTPAMPVLASPSLERS